MTLIKKIFIVLILIVSFSVLSKEQKTESNEYYYNLFSKCSAVYEIKSLYTRAKENQQETNDYHELSKFTKNMVVIIAEKIIPKNDVVKVTDNKIKNFTSKIKHEIRNRNKAYLENHVGNCLSETGYLLFKEK